MPKVILLSNAILLLSLSILMGASVSAVLVDEPILDGGPTLAASCVAWVTAGIMVATEMFSGMRYLALITVACLTVGALADGPAATVVSTLAWTVGWLTVMAWFVILAHRARENR